MTLRIASFAPVHNKPGINPDTKRPWGDADEFRREAAKFAVVHGPLVKTYLFDNHEEPDTRAKYVRDALALHADLDAIAFFCHGSLRGIQAGFEGRLGATQLGVTLARFHSLKTIALYCCDLGRDADKDRADDLLPGPGGDGGWADTLRDELAQTFSRAVTVYAHSVVAHTTKAPWVRRFSYLTGNGGEWVVEPDSNQWKAWCRMLQSSPDLRLRFPFMSQAEIDGAIARG